MVHEKSDLPTGMMAAPSIVRDIVDGKTIEKLCPFGWHSIMGKAQIGQIEPRVESVIMLGQNPCVRGGEEGVRPGCMFWDEPSERCVISILADLAIAHLHDVLDPMTKAAVMSQGKKNIPTAGEGLPKSECLHLKAKVIEIRGPGEGFIQCVQCKETLYRKFADNLIVGDTLLAGEWS